MWWNAVCAMRSSIYLLVHRYIYSILRMKWDCEATKVLINCRHRYHRLLVRHFFVCFAAIGETTSASVARNVAHTYLRGQFFLVCVLQWIPTTPPTTANNIELVCNCIIIITWFSPCIRVMATKPRIWKRKNNYIQIQPDDNYYMSVLMIIWTDFFMRFISTSSM